tara:strand:- start:43 stop:255 length:213 start_codon:yes stop_codon:yes gene_type:complete
MTNISISYIKFYFGRFLSESYFTFPEEAILVISVGKNIRGCTITAKVLNSYICAPVEVYDPIGLKNPKGP